MLTNKRILLPVIGLALVAAVAVVAVVAASGGSGDDNGGRESVNAEDQDKVAGDGAGLAICAEDVPDCNDMIVDPAGEDVKPDDPVSSDPAVSGPTSGDDIPPDQCNLVHNIDACQLQATSAAVADLAGRLGIQPEQVDLLSAELTEWPDACLGVAQPDTACAEVITTGFKIVLAAAGAEYEYHTDATGSQALLAS